MTRCRCPRVRKASTCPASGFGRIEQRRTATPEELRHDLDRQDIISLNLTRAVQTGVDIAVHLLADTDERAPTTMGEAFEALVAQSLISEPPGKRLRAAVGFRNIVVHRYQAIDWTIVHALTHTGVEDFRAFAAAIAPLLDAD
ncbi:MAG: DUF86 domain-containing protein [Porticoccaceae bacterium]